MNCFWHEGSAGTNAGIAWARMKPEAVALVAQTSHGTMEAGAWFGQAC